MSEKPTNQVHHVHDKLEDITLVVDGIMLLVERTEQWLISYWSLRGSSLAASKILRNTLT